MLVPVEPGERFGVHGNGCRGKEYMRLRRVEGV